MKSKQYNQFLEILNSLENKELTQHKVELHQLISCKDFQIRSRVATFLSNYNEPYAEELLCELLFDSSWIVRSNALQAIEEVGTNYSIESVMKACLKEKIEINIPVYISCLTYLYMRNQLNIEGLTKWLYSIKLEYYKNLRIIPYILCSLIILNNEGYFHELLSIYQFNNKEVKLSVLTALDYLCDYEIFMNKKYYRVKVLEFINEIVSNDVKFPYITYKINDIKNKNKDIEK